LGRGDHGLADGVRAARAHPGWLDWILDGGSGPALGGEVTLANLNRPGPLLIAIALPLVVFAVVRGSRARGGVAYGGDA